MLVPAVFTARVKSTVGGPVSSREWLGACLADMAADVILVVTLWELVNKEHVTGVKRTGANKGDGKERTVNHQIDARRPSCRGAEFGLAENVITDIARHDIFITADGAIGNDVSVAFAAYIFLATFGPVAFILTKLGAAIVAFPIAHVTKSKVR